MTNIYYIISQKLNLPVNSVKAVDKLLSDGATIPFISRYRKEATGALNEVQILSIEKELKIQNDLKQRKNFVIDAIRSADALTPDILKQIEAADSILAVEDIYAPWKPRKRTRATIAREKGLEPLAKIIMSPNNQNLKKIASGFVGKNGCESTEDALNGASDIIAEWASESIRLRNLTRKTYNRYAEIRCSVAKGREEELAESALKQYGDFFQQIRRLASHQYLALRRAEREGLIKVKFSLGDKENELEESLINSYMPRHASGLAKQIINDSVKDASKRLLRPSVENEISSALKEEADKIAINIFAENLRQLLLGAPLHGHNILALDPGFRTGCKVVAMNKEGTFLDDSVIYPVPPKNDFNGARLILENLIKKHNLTAIALGNGTASRETYQFLISNNILDKDKIFIVNENGASVYSASDEARREMPDKDVTVRGAVSIGRRLIDPLAELVKIDPKAIGVGQYQHDVNQSELKHSLDFTVESCVNNVGVDINTASERLLSYVSGIGTTLAKNIVDYRNKNGAFTNRKQLKNVPRMGDKAFELSAGFLRISMGNQPLDNTAIHPESYDIVAKIAAHSGVKVNELLNNKSLIDSLNAQSLSHSGLGGEHTIADILLELRKPGRDPRIDDSSKDFQPEIDSFNQLHIGKTLSGKVNNITAFGAFVDLGIKENGLIHISKLSSHRVSSVSDVLKLNQIITVKVIDLDTERHRISLQLI